MVSSVFMSSVFMSLMSSVFINAGCNKRGQTSRSVVGAEIQTPCNFEANLRNSYYSLGFVHHHFNIASGLWPIPLYP